MIPRTHRVWGAAFVGLAVVGGGIIGTVLGETILWLVTR